MTMSSSSPENTRTITAFFDSRTNAEEAVSRLIAAGFDRSSVRLVPGAQRGTDESSPEPVGFWESLKEFFLPDEDRHTFAEGLKRGGCLVSVRTDDQDYSRAVDILDDEGTIDLDERAASWRSQGWTGYTGEDYSRSVRSSLPPATGGAEDVIPVGEEQLRVGKRDVSAGRVRVRSYVVESPVEENVNLRQEHISVERRPTDQTQRSGVDPFQERTIEAEERVEQPVVAKEARVTEEVVLRKGVENRNETVRDTVRKTKVEVEDERSGDRSDAQRKR